ncbi:CopD family protein [Bradyrhizobium roseum]|uniref:CopD family protein n=1 Tax=Bradyrhizobium roseum TaxID=3056648 RepID=UPI00260F0C2B|nr:CopD family protein [Bradyrhizobium roseus]WKA29504.1 CopD family protein [Bradyrhizobium roseus]
MSLHEFLKVMHILAVVVWIGGMLAVALILPRPSDKSIVAVMRARLSIAVSCAMFAALIFGLAMAVHAGWMGQRWIHAKLVLAFTLAGVHGVITGQMRRMTTVDGHPSPSWLVHLPVVIGTLALATIAVAVLKP